MPAIELITKEDLQIFKSELLSEIKSLLKPDGVENKKWLRSNQVCKLLGISPGTLQTFRVNGTVPFTKVGGILFFKAEDIEKLMEENSSRQN